MKTLEEPPYLTVGTDVSAKYRGAFCEAKIKTAKRLVKAKVTFKQDLSTVEIHDEYIRGPLKVGASVEVKTHDGVYQEATINKLTDASLYTVVFDDGDERTLRRSSLCLKGARHFAESETLDQLPLTNPEHFGTPVIGKKGSRGRRSNQVQEEELSSSSSEEEEGDQPPSDELLGKVVCVECVAPGDKKKNLCYPALVISPDCSEEVMMKKDAVLVRSFKDGKFYAVLRRDVQELDGETPPEVEAGLKAALDGALDFLRGRVVPASWRTEVREDTSSSEEEDDEEEDAREEDASSEGEEEEVEPFPEEKDSFLQQLYKFMEDRGTPINKRPVLGYRNLNLFKLYRLVHKLGGFDSIDSGSVWKQVYQDLGIPVLNSAAGYNVKCAYRKYLYGFEEYCTSSGISFKMDLPQKVVEKQSPKQDVVKTEMDGLGSLMPPAGQRAPTPPSPQPASERSPHKEEETTPGTSRPGDGEPAAPSPAREEHKEEEEGEEDRGTMRKDDRLEDHASSLGTGDVKTKEHEDKGVQDREGDDSSQEGEGEEFECYPPGMKVQVRYGRGRNLKTYDATVKESDLEGGEVLYLVHYCGWNIRYDEWVKADKIVRPACKNGKKVKYRKKIKNKVEREKEKTEHLMDGEEVPPLVNSHAHRSSKALPHDSCPKLDGKSTEQPATKPMEITSILNALRASESSTEEESEHEYHDCDNDDEECLDVRGCPGGMVPAEGERREGGSPPEGSKTSATVEREQTLGCQGCMESSKGKSHPESEGEARTRKRKAEPQAERMAKGPCKHKSRLSDTCRPVDWPLTTSPKKREERSSVPHKEANLASSSTSSEDEEHGPREPRETGEQRRTKTKEKTRTGVRPSGFWEVAEKRPKLSLNAEERLAGGRPKGQKDVWSSIQAQWPKKTLKELFSDSDTEDASSPSPAVPGAEEPRIEPSPQSRDEDPEVREGELEPERTREFPGSGSNSVLNTPPTTPESPHQASGATTVALDATVQAGSYAPPTSPPPDLAPPPVQEESSSGRSETDSSTVEVESLGGEVVELTQEERAGSPSLAFSVSPSPAIDGGGNCSSQLEDEPMAKVVASHKRLLDSTAATAPKKTKRTHRSLGTPPKKSRRSAHSSDSEDQTANSPAPKLEAAGVKVVSRVSPSRHRCHKAGDGHSRHVYKWSFQMSDLEKMSSLERIGFLQEKLQHIRNHYLALKTEVAAIDRRRKRLKKKERESAVATSSSSSSSSSPSSSSLTAAVLLTLPEPMSGSPQGMGMSVECR